MSRVAYLGHRITLTGHFYDGTDPYDPPDVAFSVYLGTTRAAGPYLYATTAVHRLGEGVYSYTWTVPTNSSFGIYEGRFTGSVPGGVATLVEDFEVLSPVGVDLTPYLTAPRLKGMMNESPTYQIMGRGFTDRVFLLGHADGIGINDPYRVVTIQDAVNALGADDAMPLLRAMLEVYYTGCRDIYLVAVAPMSEYVPDLSLRNTSQVAWGGATFYQRYYQKLATTYQLLLEYDLPQFIVPVETSFYQADGADFLTQLTDHCVQAYTATGTIRIGILGCRGQLDDAAVETIAADDRLNTQGTAGKFVALVAGEGLMNMQELPTIYSTSVAATLAGELSTMKMDRGLCYHKLRNVIQPTHYDLTKAQIQRLALAKVNPLIRMPAGRRGTAFQTALASDNTVGQDGTDYWSLTQVRLVSKVMDRIRGYGRSVIGTGDFVDFRTRVNDYLMSLVADRTVRNFDAYVRLDEFDRSKVLADISLKPFFGVRDILFSVAVGPGA